MWIQFHFLPRVPVLMNGMSGCPSAAAIAGPEGTAVMGSKAGPISQKVAFMKILLAWIGNSDMRAVKPEKPGDKSPILEAMTVLTYDAVHLISTFPKSESDNYVEWAKRGA